MKEKLKCVKCDSSLFILLTSFCESYAFAARKVSFDRAKGYVSSTAPKVMFHRLKHDLSCSETIPLAQRNDTFGKFIFSKPLDYRLDSL